MASYTVKSGDTLSAIAKKYGVSIGSITGYRSGNPNLIYPGETLTIGSGGQSTPAVSGASTTQRQTFGDLLAKYPASKQTPTTSNFTKAVTYSSLPATTAPSQTKITAGYVSQPTQTLANTSQQTGISIPSFNFDWTAAEQEALQKLTPYYEKLLSESKGDVDLALQRLEQDYQIGVRTRAEDQAAQESEAKRQTEEELRSNLGTLNQRGVLFGEGEASAQGKSPYSGYANTFFLNPLQERQQARNLAIQRAFSRQQELSDINKSRSISDQQKQFERYKSALEEEKKAKAVTQMAPMKYQQELAKYNANISGSLGGYI